MKRIFCWVSALLMLAALLAPLVPPATAADGDEEGYIGPTGGAFLVPIRKLTDQQLERSVVISDRAGLEAIRSNLGGTYRLTQDIYLSGENWVPIDGFSGTFDGQGYVIHDLTITGDRTGERRFTNAGLFGNTTTTATIRDVGLEGTNIDITFYRNANVGGISGSGGVISNCYNEGSISAMANGSAYVGGINGSNGSVSNSYNTALISASSDRGSTTRVYAGGISGSGTVSGSYNTGDIFASSHSTNATASVYAGGINGSGTVSGSYNTGDVSASSDSASTSTSNASRSNANAGGICGNGDVSDSYNMGTVTADAATTAAASQANAGGITNNGDVIRCYNGGTVSSSSVSADTSRSLAYAGGISGSGGSVYNSYWYEESAETATGDRQDTTGRLDEDQINQPDSFMGFSSEARTFITIVGTGTSTGGIISIIRELSGIEIIQGNMLCSVGDMTKLFAIDSQSYIRSTDVTWDSSDRQVVTVDEAGRITALSDGRALITATRENGDIAICEIEVDPAYDWGDYPRSLADLEEEPWYADAKLRTREFFDSLRQEGFTSSRQELLDTVSSVSIDKRYIVLVLDESGSMGQNYRAPLNALREAANLFCGNILPNTYIAVVRYSTDAETIQRFTNDPDLLSRAITSSTDEPSGGTNMYEALKCAERLLDTVLRDVPKGVDCGSIFLMSDGCPQTGEKRETGRYEKEFRDQNFGYYKFANCVYELADTIKNKKGYNILSLGFFHDGYKKNGQPKIWLPHAEQFMHQDLPSDIFKVAGKALKTAQNAEELTNQFNEASKMLLGETSPCSDEYLVGPEKGPEVIETFQPATKTIIDGGDPPPPGTVFWPIPVLGAFGVLTLILSFVLLRKGQP